MNEGYQITSVLIEEKQGTKIYMCNSYELYTQMMFIRSNYTIMF